MKKIIVTGGAGYIGSHTVVELQQAGFEVVIADNFCNSTPQVIDGIAKITGVRPTCHNKDVAVSSDMEDFFARHSDACAVVHFAAHKAVGESVKLPLKYYRNNLFGMINILEQMQKYGIANLVFSSSCCVYGQPDELPVTELSPIQKAESPYGNTKQICEEIIHDTVSSSRNSLRAIALRYFNPIGAHASAEIGELPTGKPDNLLPFVTQTAIGKQEQLLVFGHDYNTPDGTCIRDYINVVDLAKAHLVAINRLLASKTAADFEVFNLGTGKGTSVLQIIKAFESVAGTKLNYTFAPRRAGDVEQVWADVTKANNVLGWHAEIPLNETIASAWNWEKKLAGKLP